jgi:D-serine deaminase-like pyridoxal phosphate-dependent protein
VRYTALVRLADLPTPCVLVELSRLDSNVDRMQAAADAGGKQLRPHAKTHKSTTLAQRQIARGAIGICCAKLGEAEVFADAGIEDIRVAYPLNPVNSGRVLALLERTRFSFIVDHADVAGGWSDAMRRADREVDVLVKVDVGLHRCGIDPQSDGAAEFVVRLARLPGLRFKGLLSHAGHAYGAGSIDGVAAVAREEARMMTSLATRIRELGVEVSEISVGSTPTAPFSAQQEGLTELRPGNYIYNDRMQVALGGASWDDCALTVLARVVTTHPPDRLIFDSGSKTLTTDQVKGTGGTTGYGAVLRTVDARVPDESLLIERLSEEHATVRVLPSGRREPDLEPGDLVRIVPNHSCVVANLVDHVWLVDGDEVVERVDVSARGRIA